MKRLALFVYRGLLVALALAVTIGSGMLHGNLRNRWGLPPEMQVAAAQLQQIPSDFGGWQVRSSEPLSEGAVEMLECEGYVNRTYVNRQTGEAVNLVVLLGPPGPVSVHRPEICYSSRDYTQMGQRQRVSLHAGRASAADFWSLRLRANDVHARGLYVYYAWSDGHNWSATTNPRWSYSGRPWLYKMQLTAPAPHPTEGQDDPTAPDTCQNFLQALLPAMHGCLVVGDRRPAYSLPDIFDLRNVTRGN